MLARWFLEEERHYYLALTQIPESKAERAFLDWLRRTIEGKTAGKWRPLEVTVKIGKRVSCKAGSSPRTTENGRRAECSPKNPARKAHPGGATRMGQHVRGHVYGHAAALLPAREEGRTRPESADSSHRSAPVTIFRGLSEEFPAGPSRPQPAPATPRDGRNALKIQHKMTIDKNFQPFQPPHRDTLGTTRSIFKYITLLICFLSPLPGKCVRARWLEWLESLLKVHKLLILLTITTPSQLAEAGWNPARTAGSLKNRKIECLDQSNEPNGQAPAGGSAGAGR